MFFKCKYTFTYVNEDKWALGREGGLGMKKKLMRTLIIHCSTYFD